MQVDFNFQSRITAMRGWSIPASGKDYVTKDIDMAETGVPGVEGGELVSDVRSKLLRIPAAVPGSVIGYEVEQEQQPYDMSDEWGFQETVPVREARYSVQLPAGSTTSRSGSTTPKRLRPLRHLASGLGS